MNANSLPTRERSQCRTIAREHLKHAAKHKITIPFDPIHINFDPDDLKNSYQRDHSVNEIELIRAYFALTNVFIRSNKAYMTMQVQANEIHEIIDITGRIKYVRVSKRGGLKKVSQKEVKNEMEGLKVQRAIGLLGDNSDMMTSLVKLTNDVDIEFGLVDKSKASHLIADHKQRLRVIGEPTIKHEALSACASHL